MIGPLHLPTAIAMVLLGALLALANARRNRRHRLGSTLGSQGFVSAEERATFHTLHTVSLAGRFLGDGLTQQGTERAAPHLREVLGVPAVAICEPTSLLVWDGVGSERHRAYALEHARSTLTNGQIHVIEHSQLNCLDPQCLIRGSVIAPIEVSSKVVASLACYAPVITPALTRATQELAAWIAVQVESAELEQERVRAMTAELQALRAQISPHFVYNCLGTIASFVRTDPERARELILEFADFTRYALRRTGAFTTLADELRNVERYLVLEQARFGDQLRVKLQIAPEVLPLSIPDLVIQPLVENAVRHGLGAREGPGNLVIIAREVGSTAEISIDDDGVGADPEEIRRILDGVVVTDSLGLSNVDSRLRQVYGPASGLTVETAPGAGTRVSFCVPKFAPGVHP